MGGHVSMNITPDKPRKTLRQSCIVWLFAIKTPEKSLEKISFANTQNVKQINSSTQGKQT